MSRSGRCSISSTWQRAIRPFENRAAAGTVLPLYLCPSTTRLASDRVGNTTGDINHNGAWDPGDDLAVTDYGGNYGFFGLNKPVMTGVLVYETPISIKKITDGTSHTMIVAEDTGAGRQLRRPVVKRRKHFRHKRPDQRSFATAESLAGQRDLERSRRRCARVALRRIGVVFVGIA